MSSQQETEFGNADGLIRTDKPSFGDLQEALATLVGRFDEYALKSEPTTRQYRPERYIVSMVAPGRSVQFHLEDDIAAGSAVYVVGLPVSGGRTVPHVFLTCSILDLSADADVVEITLRTWLQRYDEQRLDVDGVVRLAFGPARLLTELLRGIPWNALHDKGDDPFGLRLMAVRAYFDEPELAAIEDAVAYDAEKNRLYLDGRYVKPDDLFNRLMGAPPNFDVAAVLCGPVKNWEAVPCLWEGMRAVRNDTENTIAAGYLLFASICRWSEQRYAGAPPKEVRHVK